MSTIFNHINQHQQKSKRDRIVNGILDAIDNKDILEGDQLPSVNQFILKLGFARMTVVKALNILKERGVIISEDKVGNFVRNFEHKRELKVFLFLSGFNTYHEVLYNTIIEDLKNKKITIDIYFHHCNPRVFKTILDENLGSYGLYIITGFDNSQVSKSLLQIPKRKLLQIIRPPLLEGVSSVYQDFSIGLRKCLEKLKHRLDRYSRFILIFPSPCAHPEAIRSTFLEFCNKHNIKYAIEKKMNRDLLVEKSAFWVIEDSDLLDLINIGEGLGFSVGNDFGILSYNETPVKEIIRNGITVISANFVSMGHAISRFIINPDPTTEVFEPDVIVRNSL